MCWDLWVDRGAWSERLRKNSAVRHLCQALRTLANGVWRLLPLWLTARETPDTLRPVGQKVGRALCRCFAFATQVSGRRPSRRSMVRSPLHTKCKMASNGSYPWSRIFGTRSEMQ